MNVLDFLAIAAAFAVTGWFIRIVTARDRDAPRHSEDDARSYLDEHGHWPDETPEEADERRRRSAEAERIARASYRGG